MKTTGKTAPPKEKGTPDKSKLVSGAYKTTTWNHFSSDNGRLFSGIWESTPGTVKVQYDEWEFCHFIQGEAVLTREDGKTWRLKRGDAFIIPSGFKGTWQTVRKVKKHYVILMPEA
ncbi:MAG: cupin domain-containing protein [Alphaproteobacteria bacterium]|nr:cupin domain-containing protein [Alphaproteobacteria bacterium]